MGTGLVPIQNEVLVPADLSRTQAVHDFLGQLLDATRGEGKGTLTGALVPYVCDRLKSNHSRKALASDLREFVAHMQLHGIAPEQVTGDDVRIYAEALTQAGLRSASVSRKLSMIRGTYTQWGKKGLVDWETVQDIKATTSPRVTKNATPALTQTEAAALLKVAREKATIGGKLSHEKLIAIRDYALLFTFVRTVCRVSAVASCKVGHIERTDSDWYLRVTEKGKKESRKVLLEAVPALLAYLDAAGIREDLEGPLFRPLAKDRKGFERKHLRRNDILQVVKKYSRLAGIQVDRIDSRGVGVHSLRKTGITNALKTEPPC